MSTSTTESATAPRDMAKTIWPDVSLVGVALIWGTNIPIMKGGLEHIDIYVFNAVRLVISAIVLVACARRERQRGVLPDRQFGLRHILVYGLMVGVVYQLLFLLGIKRTTAGNTALIIATVPMWTALLAYFFIGEALRALAWGGLVISLVGTVIVAMQKGDVGAGREHLLGNAIVLGAALLWASGTVYSRPLLKWVSPVQLAAGSALVSVPFHLLFAVGKYRVNLPALESPSLWLILLFSGVLSSGLAQPMWSFGVRHAGAAHAAVVQNLIPVVAIIVAWVAHGEATTTPQLLGGAMILVGLATMRLAR